MSRTLAEWLVYQQHVNPHAIELGLDRVRSVWQRMGAPAPAKRVITVAGTNGKGSTVALIEAMARGAGLRVGAYTSPHLLKYNERIRVDGVDADDAALLASFERIETARGDTTLTFFEYATLAALDLFARAKLDLAVLEVGLGGRLDAVNIVDADVAVITTIDLDHMEWLGPDRDSIGREKAGVARAGHPAIIGEDDPPAGLLDALATIGARVEQAGVDFTRERHADGWHWRHADGTAMDLPVPAVPGDMQYANAGAAIAALHALWIGGGPLVPEDAYAAVCRGLRHVRINARLQPLGGDPALFVDVGHNPQAARVIATWLDEQPPARTHAVYGAFKDKDVAGVIAALGTRIACWHLAPLDAVSPRGMAMADLRATLVKVLPQAVHDEHADVAAALAAARKAAQPGERIVAFGSFFIAAAVIAATQA